MSTSDISSFLEVTLGCLLLFVTGQTYWHARKHKSLPWPPAGHPWSALTMILIALSQFSLFFKLREVAVVALALGFITAVLWRIGVGKAKKKTD
jgi:hypothetical protein